MESIGSGVIGLLVAIGALAFGFWIWMLVDCATKEADTGNTKIAWVIIVIFTGIIGAVIYYLVRRPRRWAEMGR